jgi:hypothetical protein
VNRATRISLRSFGSRRLRGIIIVFVGCLAFRSTVAEGRLSVQRHQTSRRERFRTEHDHLARVFNARIHRNGCSRQRNTPAGLDYSLGGRLLHDWCLGSGCMICYVTSGSGMRNFRSECQEESRLTATSSLEHFPRFGRCQSDFVGVAGCIDERDLESPTTLTRQHLQELPRRRNEFLG